jgi:hypothetical protein
MALPTRPPKPTSAPSSSLLPPMSAMPPNARPCKTALHRRPSLYVRSYVETRAPTPGASHPAPTTGAKPASKTLADATAKAAAPHACLGSTLRRPTATLNSDKTPTVTTSPTPRPLQQRAPTRHHWPLRQRLPHRPRHPRSAGVREDQDGREGEHEAGSYRFTGTAHRRVSRAVSAHGSVTACHACHAARCNAAARRRHAAGTCRAGKTAPAAAHTATAAAFPRLPRCPLQRRSPPPPPCRRQTPCQQNRSTARRNRRHLLQYSRVLHSTPKVLRSTPQPHRQHLPRRRLPPPPPPARHRTRRRSPRCRR